MHSLADDIAQRWRCARRAALRASLPDSRDEHTEAELLPLALEADTEAVLRRAFDNSRKLGSGFRAYHRTDLPLADLALLLPELSTPCSSSPWTKIDDPLHYRSERLGCSLARKHPRTCDFYREAIDGLVLGLSGTAFHARHESVGTGGSRCVDVLYVHPQSPVRFGPIPGEIAEGLAGLRRTTALFDSTVRIEFLGISERVLYYSLSSGRGSGSVNLTTVIERGVQRRYPWLVARDVSPKAVLNEPQA